MKGKNGLLHIAEKVFLPKKENPQCVYGPPEYFRDGKEDMAVTDFLREPDGSWKCPCGCMNTGDLCRECGREAPMITRSVDDANK